MIEGAHEIHDFNLNFDEELTKDSIDLALLLIQRWKGNLRMFRLEDDVFPCFYSAKHQRVSKPGFNISLSRYLVKDAVILNGSDSFNLRYIDALVTTLESLDYSNACKVLYARDHARVIVGGKFI